MRRARLALPFCVLALLAPLAASAEEITGPARVVDADGIAIGDRRIALFGIESVERAQICFIQGRPWECYPAAVRTLETLSSVADVTCTTIGEPDQYGRVLATCTVAGEDLAEALVRAGFALAKRDETEDYVPAEEAARAGKVGLWQAEFMYPRDFRLSHGIFLDRP